MGLDVGVIKKIEHLEQPSDTVKNFANEIINDDRVCTCAGFGGALVFAFKDQLQKRAGEYTNTMQELHEITEWLDSLPWDKDDYIRLYFNWSRREIWQ